MAKGSPRGLGVVQRMEVVASCNQARERGGQGVCGRRRRRGGSGFGLRAAASGASKPTFSCCKLHQAGSGERRQSLRVKVALLQSAGGRRGRTSRGRRPVNGKLSGGWRELPKQGLARRPPLTRRGDWRAARGAMDVYRESRSVVGGLLGLRTRPYSGGRPLQDRKRQAPGLQCPFRPPMQGPRVKQTLLHGVDRGRPDNGNR